MYFLRAFIFYFLILRTKLSIDYFSQISPRSQSDGRRQVHGRKQVDISGRQEMRALKWHASCVCAVNVLPNLRWRQCRPAN